MKCTYSFIVITIYTFHVLCVRVAGLEPTTSSFQVKHSTRLSYTLIVLDAPRGLEPQFLESKSSVLPLDEGAKIGEGTESRTLASSFGDWRATITLYQHIGGRCENWTHYLRAWDLQSRPLPSGPSTNSVFKEVAQGLAPQLTGCSQPRMRCNTSGEGN